MTTLLSANGLIEIPEVFRKADSLEAGQPYCIERMGHGDYRVRVGASRTSGATKERLIDVLLSCPVKDWWVEPERSERTSLEASALFAE